MKEGLVSVIIPCYNHEKFIIKTLQSIVDNSYKNIEIILIDDGSKDNSYEIAKEFLTQNFSRFKNIIIKKQSNQGVTKTLNRMISYSNGEYITLLASDDYLTENSILDRVNFLKKTGKSAVIGRAYLIDFDNNILSKNASKKLYLANEKILKSNKINQELILRWSVVGPTLLLKKSLYQEIGIYNEDLKVEDRDFYLRVLKNNELSYLDKNVAYYRVHTENVSRNIKTKLKILKEIAEVNIKYSKYEFENIEKLYMKSYIIDKKLIEKNYIKILYFYKGIRKIIVEIYLWIMQGLIKNEKNY